MSRETVVNGIIATMICLSLGAATVALWTHVYSPPNCEAVDKGGAWLSKPVTTHAELAAEIDEMLVDNHWLGGRSHPPELSHVQ